MIKTEYCDRLASMLRTNIRSISQTTVDAELKPTRDGCLKPADADFFIVKRAGSETKFPFYNRSATLQYAVTEHVQI